MWIEKFLIPALLAIVTALCTYMVQELKASRKMNNANAKGTMLLLRRQLIADHEKFCQKGEPMSHFEFEDMVEIHSTYKELGGNGLTDKMFEDLQAIDLAGGQR